LRLIQSNRPQRGGQVVPEVLQPVALAARTAASDNISKVRIVHSPGGNRSSLFFREGQDIETYPRACAVQTQHVDFWQRAGPFMTPVPIVPSRSLTKPRDGRSWDSILESLA